MILTVFIAISTLGFAGWIAGTILNMPGIAAIGGVLVVGAGGMVLVDGLQHQDGRIEATNATTNETVVTKTYDTVETLPSFSLGSLVTLLGGVQVIRALDNAANQP